MTENQLRVLHVLVMPIQMTLCVLVVLEFERASWLWYAFLLPNVFLLCVRQGIDHMSSSRYVSTNDFEGDLRVFVFAWLVFFASLTAVYLPLAMLGLARSDSADSCAWLWFLASTHIMNTVIDRLSKGIQT